MSQNSEIRKIELEYVDFQLIDGVLKAIYKPSVITLDIAKEVVQKRKEFCDFETYPHLITQHAVAKMTKEARDFFSSPEATEGVLAAAMITNSVFKRTMVNFFLNVTRPKIPVRMFVKEEEAVDWLKEWLKQ